MENRACRTAMTLPHVSTGITTSVSTRHPAYFLSPHHVYLAGILTPDVSIHRRSKTIATGNGRFWRLEPHVECAYAAAGRQRVNLRTLKPHVIMNMNYLTAFLSCYIQSIMDVLLLYEPGYNYILFPTEGFSPRQRAVVTDHGPSTSSPIYLGQKFLTERKNPFACIQTPSTVVTSLTDFLSRLSA